ncbi:hypothetical protein Q1695_013545 [Nippostrongylus brasiliensis]|nr:hypothetical protein Q1695_013545 [Nippostrongylus brasiliensis]
MTVLVSGMSEISAASLAAIVRNADTTTLIVDCRCLAEFKQSHICRATNPFYSKLLQRRLLENKVDHFRLANQLRSAASCDEEFSNGMVDVVLYTDEQPSEMQPARFCSKRRISSGNCSESPAKIVRHLREQLECTNIFRKIQILEVIHKARSTFILEFLYVVFALKTTHSIKALKHSRSEQRKSV